MPSDEFNLENNDFGLNFFEILKVLHRQKKYIFLSGILVFIIGFSYSLLERNFKPIYGGYFTLLVEDPFKKVKKKFKNFVEDIALIKLQTICLQ